MIRTLKSHVEEKVGMTIRLDAPIVPWIVRHAGYLITRCRVKEDGRTALEKIKGRKVNTPLVPFGEVVLFKLPKLPHMPGDFRDRFERGVWVGCLARSGEHLIATDKGVFTVSTLQRCSDDQRWSGDLIRNIKGNPREPVPGSGSGKLHAYSKKRQ